MTTPVADRGTPSGPVQADWHTIAPRREGQVSLRCWWARPAGGAPRAGVLVLPEVFGINGWVRRVAGRLAAEGYGALAMPLFSRSAPELELGYDDDALREGRAHKERTTTAQLLDDLSLASGWLQEQVGHPEQGLGCVGFCFGGHVAMLAATLPAITATVDCYGAGVASGRPGGGPPTLAVVPTIPGRLLCLFGDQDPLIPAADRQAVAAALAAANRQRPAADAHRLEVLAGGHGFLCEERSDFHPEAAAAGWSALLGWLRDSGL